MSSQVPSLETTLLNFNSLDLGSESEFKSRLSRVRINEPVNHRLSVLQGLGVVLMCFAMF